MDGQANQVVQPSGSVSTLSSPSGSAPSGKGLRLEEPASRREITTREKIILLEGSKLNGYRFAPWKSPVDFSEFERLPGPSQYLDDAELGLSETQLELFDGWRRPDEVVKALGPRNSPKPTMQTDGKIDLVQDVTSDCSVVASLCVVIAREERGQSNIITCNLYPYDDNLKQPTISPNGKYILKLHFNGCSRRVIIDDRLPASRTSQTLHVIDRNHPNLIWPALIEKAYLKVRGGYDFPGSNSGTDLHVLTGWIPEQLFLQRCAQCLKLTSSDHGSDRMLTQVSYNDSDDIARSALWTRICNAFNYGDVLITLGTGKLTLKEEEGLGLAGEHDYAVVDVKEQEGQQLFLVKNPWFNGTIWKGHIYRRGTTIDAVKSLNDLHINPEREPLAQGMFWIGLNDVFQSFDSIYLNWNPGLFSFREDVHFKWDLAQSTNSEGSFVSNPQYEIRSSTGGIVWVLLSRHFASAVGTSANSVGTSPSNTSPTQSFISLYAFDNDGEKVFLSDGASSRGPYVDSPNTLLKLELSANRAQTIVISEQALSRTNHTFTLSAYSLTGLTISKAREKLNYCDVQHGAWKSSTAGGNTSSPSYHINPQYSLILADTSDLAILLENPVQGIQVHVQLVWAGGKPIRAITNRDVAGHSGDYKNGYAFAEIHGLPDGAYTIVCSTFEQGQLGSFTLRVCSTSAFTIDRISVEAAGRFVTKVRAAEFTPGADRLIALLISRRLNRVAVKARPIEGTRRSERSPHSPLKLGIEYGQGPSKQILTTSSEDEYSGRSAGIWTGDVDIQPHMCQGRGVWLVLERLGSTELQHNEYVEVELLSDVPIELSEWHVREGI